MFPVVNVWQERLLQPCVVTTGDVAAGVLTICDVTAGVGSALALPVFLRLAGLASLFPSATLGQKH